MKLQASAAMAVAGANAIAAINEGDVNSKPLLQVLDLKVFGTNSGNRQERYRLVLSDAVSTQHAMLATQLDDRVKSGSIRRGSIVQLIELRDRIIFVLNLETIILDCEIIGNPRMLTEANSTATTASITSVYQNPEHARATGNIVNARSNSLNMQRSSNSSSSCSKGHGAIIKNEAPACIVPIATLNPYRGRWAIKARVTLKGDLRRYNNAWGDGKFFSFDLFDSDGGEIPVTCFNAVVDRFYDIIEVGKVYVISMGSLKPAQKNFNHLNNAWEIFLEATSTVDLCPDEDASIPKQQFSFRPISEIEFADNNAILDVIGIVISVNPSSLILRKNGMETQRRILNLKDESGRSVQLTMWGDICNREGQKLQDMLDSGLSPVLAVKAGKVNDFSGKSIGTISATQLFMNPDFPEAHRLRHWFNSGGRNSASQSISREVTPGGPKNEIGKLVSQINDEGLGRSDKPDWVTIKATVEFEECDYRYLLQAQAQDHTGLTWVTAFQESAEEMLGCFAKELYFLKYEEEDDARFSEVMKASLFKHYLFRLKIKEELYGDEQRVKITVAKADKMDYAAESRRLVDLVAR
ncbi:Replication protein A, OB domain [Dillenia turbinata]|uniref:Replication protein A subunit n=1 Tax=Dillenia turbinata TaxID=194707 RepID=A0AAN8ZNZ2_9MAGN